MARKAVAVGNACFTTDSWNTAFRTLGQVCSAFLPHHHGEDAAAAINKALFFAVLLFPFLLNGRQMAANLGQLLFQS